MFDYNIEEIYGFDRHASFKDKDKKEFLRKLKIFAHFNERHLMIVNQKDVIKYCFTNEVSSYRKNEKGIWIEGMDKLIISTNK